jgi:hypothetical protein
VDDAVEKDFLLSDLRDEPLVREGELATRLQDMLHLVEIGAETPHEQIVHAVRLAGDSLEMKLGPVGRSLGPTTGSDLPAAAAIPEAFRVVDEMIEKRKNRPRLNGPVRGARVRRE